MSAIQDAIKLYGPTFASLHGLYLERGYCYSEPDILGLARPCHSSNYLLWVEPDEADAWWIEFIVGHRALGVLCSKLPFDLPKIGWQRDFKGKHAPRFYNLSKLKTTLYHHGF